MKIPGANINDVLADALRGYRGMDHGKESFLTLVLMRKGFPYNMALGYVQAFLGTNDDAEEEKDDPHDEPPQHFQP